MPKQVFFLVLYVVGYLLFLSIMAIFTDPSDIFIVIAFVIILIVVIMERFDRYDLYALLNYPLYKDRIKKVDFKDTLVTAKGKIFPIKYFLNNTYMYFVDVEELSNSRYKIDFMRHATTREKVKICVDSIILSKYEALYLYDYLKHNTRQLVDLDSTISLKNNLNTIYEKL